MLLLAIGKDFFNKDVSLSDLKVLEMNFSEKANHSKKNSNIIN